MKKALLTLILSFTFGVNSFAAWDPTKPVYDEYIYDDLIAIRANWDAIALGTDAALQITNAKIAAGAGIVDTKLAQITTAGKVSGAALTLLGSVPSGSTALPIAAGGTGQTTRQAALNALSATSLSGTTGQGLVSDGTNMALGYPASLTIASAATGDLLWFNGTAWVRLAPGTADYALVSNGAGSAPGYEQVNLATGVQGVLPVANGGTGTTSLTDIGIPSQTGNSGKFLTTNGSAASWGDAYTETQYTAGDNIVYWNSGTYSTDGGGYDKVFPTFRVYVNFEGVVRIKYTITTSGSGWTRLYKNGVAIGAQNNTPGSFTDDNITVAKGDYFEMYAHATSNIQNMTSFKICIGEPVYVANTVTMPPSLVMMGAGVPNAALGVQGQIYLRTDGSASTTLYVKTGASTWTAK